MQFLCTSFNTLLCFKLFIFSNYKHIILIEVTEIITCWFFFTFLNPCIRSWETELYQFCDVFVWHTHITNTVIAVNRRWSFIPLRLISWTKFCCVNWELVAFKISLKWWNSCIVNDNFGNFIWFISNKDSQSLRTKPYYMLLICKRQDSAIVYTPINIIDISLNYFISSSTH